MRPEKNITTDWPRLPSLNEARACRYYIIRLFQLTNEPSMPVKNLWRGRLYPVRPPVKSRELQRVAYRLYDFEQPESSMIVRDTLSPPQVVELINRGKQPGQVNWLEEVSRFRQLWQNSKWAKREFVKKVGRAHPAQLDFLQQELQEKEEALRRLRAQLQEWQQTIAARQTELKSSLSS